VTPEDRDAIRSAGAEDGRRSRLAQGLPERIEDPDAARRLAIMLDAHGPERGTESKQ
jgi:hypothetical protein